MSAAPVKRPVIPWKIHMDTSRKLVLIRHPRRLWVGLQGVRNYERKRQLPIAHICPGIRISLDHFGRSAKIKFLFVQKSNSPFLLLLPQCGIGCQEGNSPPEGPSDSEGLSGVSRKRCGKGQGVEGGIGGRASLSSPAPAFLSIFLSASPS